MVIQALEAVKERHFEDFMPKLEKIMHDVDHKYKILYVERVQKIEDRFREFSSIRLGEERLSREAGLKQPQEEQ